MLRLVLVSCLCVSVWGQRDVYKYLYPPTTTTEPPRIYNPPAIVHKVEIGSELDGNYEFTYDTGRGPLGQSYRTETRLPDGTVKGSYGYLDVDGKLRIVKYIAGKGGFVAQGDVGPEGAPRGVAPGPAPVPEEQPPRYSSQQNYAPQPQRRPQVAPRQTYVLPPEKEEDLGPPFIDTSLLSYDIGAKQKR
ncbi:uncharacterized protein LOC143254088 [Tachypleus tridentatus]|uniref:uncharacterized protein LOC143254088 n=1 Tax=Tachypleus tridentatus TaxID=6853 RepID=UPI003FD0F6A7